MTVVRKLIRQSMMKSSLHHTSAANAGAIERLLGVHPPLPQIHTTSDEGRGQLAAAFASRMRRCARTRLIDQSNAAPTMILRMSSHGDPCEMLFVCVG